MPDDEAVLLTVPQALREALREPLGPVYRDVSALLADITGPIAAVGDIVTYHLLEADRRPALALVDERTERSAVDAAVRESVVPNGPEHPRAWFDRRLEATNPAGTITRELLAAIEAGLASSEECVLVRVDGEEDLATLPAVAVAPDDWTVVYGQPGVGMVAAPVDDRTRAIVTALLDRMDGDPAAVRDWQVGVRADLDG